MATTPQISSPKANCTRVVERFNADAFVVCRAGSIVALHFFTRQGEVIITTTEKEFVQSARSDRDHNGNPWRVLPDANAREKILLADAAAVPAKMSAMGKTRGPRGPKRAPELTAKFAAVQAQKYAGSPLSFVQLCREAGIKYGTFMMWRSDHKPAHSQPRMEASA